MNEITNQKNNNRVLVAMSGGVDSSVAAALLVEQGYEVVGVTMKLWGGESDSGCCSISDVDDARRVAQQLGIEHHVFNFGDDFMKYVVGPYIEEHEQGRTPNPCIECNRHIKFDRLLQRAELLGFERVATGHHAQIVADNEGILRMTRGADTKKDQSYVLYMLDQLQLANILLPVGSMTKDDVRAEAKRLGLRTASKPDSQDVCFITAADGGRVGFLNERMSMTPATVVDKSGREFGTVSAVELVTLGQRKGLGLGGEPEPLYVIDTDVREKKVIVGKADELLTSKMFVHKITWSEKPFEGAVTVQCSAHGEPLEAQITLHNDADDGKDLMEGQDAVVVIWDEPQRKIASGQSVVFYTGSHVLGGGMVP